MSGRPFVPIGARAVPWIEGFDEFEVIGEGGFATVFKASQPAFERHVALKVVHVKDIDGDLQQRFERECRAVGALSSHANIVTVYGAGVTSDGQSYLVMELVSGGSLGARLKSGSPLTAAEAVHIGVDLLKAVEAAHARGVIHRDIKPDNVLISSDGVPKLADFGISSIPGGYETGSGQITATMAYAAPEVVNGERASEDSDIYSVGATIASLVLGGPPFPRHEGELLLPYIQRLLTETPPSLLPRGVSTELNDVVQRALSKSPHDRYPSAAEFRSALELTPEAAATGSVAHVTDGTVAPAPSEIITERSRLASEAPTLMKGRRRRSGDGTSALADPVSSVKIGPHRFRRRATAAIGAALLLGTGGGAWALAHAGEPDRGDTDSTSPKSSPVPAEQVTVATPSITQHCDGLFCTFTGTQSGSGQVAAGWTWSFGDGSTAKGSNTIKHRYAEPGAYQVGLSATVGETSAQSSARVEIGSFVQSITVTAGAPGSRQLTASIVAPDSCRPDRYVVEEKVGGSWVRRATDLSSGGSHTIGVASEGTYRVSLLKKTVPAGVCSAAVSRPVVLQPAATTGSSGSTSSSSSSSSSNPPSSGSHSSGGGSGGGGGGGPKPIHPPITG